jgi:GTP-binding protein
MSGDALMVVAEINNLGFYNGFKARPATRVFTARPRIVSACASGLSDKLPASYQHTMTTPAPSKTSTEKGDAKHPKPDPKIAMGWLHTAKFLTTAPELKHLPRLDVPEIAFVGRSNAGKSTCINTLTQQHRLAYASKTPGRTQSINLFTLGKQGVTDAVLTDLPGYGYAAVPREAKIRWQQVMGNYLQTRDNLKAVVLMCDPRRGMTELDEILLDVIRPRVEEGLKFLILLTKSDKLNKTEGAKALQIAKLNAGGGDVMLFSALKKQGVEAVAQHLWDWTHPYTSSEGVSEAKTAPNQVSNVALDQ